MTAADLAADMRRRAGEHLAALDLRLKNAAAFNQRAEDELAAARLLRALVNGYEAVAGALQTGAIDVADGMLLAKLRDGLGAAQAALNPLAATPLAVAFGTARADRKPAQTWTLPTYGAKTQAEILAEAEGFDLDDVVNVSDPEHSHFGVRGTVDTVRNDGLITVCITDAGDLLTLPPSSLTLHAAFVAQMDAAEQQAAKDAEAADDVYSAEERADDDAWAEAAADYAASLDPGIEADL